jgi:hypothetical protein
MQNSKDWRHGKARKGYTSTKTSAKKGCLIERISNREAQAEMRWAR